MAVSDRCHRHVGSQTAAILPFCEGVWTGLGVSVGCDGLRLDLAGGFVLDSPEERQKEILTQ